jgi:hypothetical protein
MPDIFISSQNKKPEISKNNNPIPEKTIPCTVRMLSALVHHPENFTFRQKDEDEKIILFMRRHFVTNLPWIIATTIATIAPLFITLLVQTFDLSTVSLSSGLSITLLFFYYILVLGFALFNFVDWFYNMGIASNKRLLDLDFEYLSHIDLSLTKLHEVEDIIYRQKGFFPSFFNYGDVIAHTVTGKEDFVFDKVPHPVEIVDIISKYLADNKD